MLNADAPPSKERIDAYRAKSGQMSDAGGDQSGTEDITGQNDT